MVDIKTPEHTKYLEEYGVSLNTFICKFGHFSFDLTVIISVSVTSYDSI